MSTLVSPRGALSPCSPRSPRSPRVPLFVGGTVADASTTTDDETRKDRDGECDRDVMLDAQSSGEVDSGSSTSSDSEFVDRLGVGTSLLGAASPLARRSAVVRLLRSMSTSDAGKSRVLSRDAAECITDSQNGGSNDDTQVNCSREGATAVTGSASPRDNKVLRLSGDALASGNPRIGISAVFDDSTPDSSPVLVVREREQGSGTASSSSQSGNLRRRLSNSARSALRRGQDQSSASDGTHTLIIYEPDPVVGSGAAARLFLVPDSCVCAYMRTSLMRAHASTNGESPFRFCRCSAEACEHPLPDAAAKFVALYVLCGYRPSSRTDPLRHTLREHVQKRPTLTAALWSCYEQTDPCQTSFVGASIEHVYRIRNFI